MKQTVYIIASKSGIERLTKRHPFLGRGEIGVKLTVTIPDAAFSSPLIAAALDVEDEHVIQPTVTIEPHEAPREDEDLSQAPEAPDVEAGLGEVPASLAVGSDR